MNHNIIYLEDSNKQQRLKNTFDDSPLRFSAKHVFTSDADVAVATNHREWDLFLRKNVVISILRMVE